MRRWRPPITPAGTIRQIMQFAIVQPETSRVALCRGCGRIEKVKIVKRMGSRCESWYCLICKGRVRKLKQPPPPMVVVTSTKGEHDTKKEGLR